MGSCRTHFVQLEYGRFLIEKLPEGTKFRGSALQSFIEYFCQLNLPLVVTAYVLDPNHKMEYISDYAQDEVKLFLMTILFDMSEEDEIGAGLTKEWLLYTSGLIDFWLGGGLIRLIRAR